jgi:AraC-like DNA-binding protein
MLLLLHTSPALAYSAGRLGEWYEVQLVSTWDQLWRRSRSLPSDAMAIVDPYFQQQGRIAGELERYMSDFPSVPVLAALVPDARRLDDVRRLGAMGISGVVSLDEEATRRALLMRVTTARAGTLRRTLKATLPPSFDPRARLVLDRAAELALHAGTVSDLAKELMESERTLLRRCERLGLPKPGEILGWMRILIAAALLNDPGRTVSSVAASCGYYSDTTLRRAVVSRTGMLPGQLRSAGGLRAAIPKFLDTLRREQSRLKSAPVGGR